MKKDITGKEALVTYRSVLIVIVVILAVVLMLFNFLSHNEATLSVIAPVRGSIVILDNSIAGQSSTSSEEIRKSVYKGTHTILVSAENRWPWYKEVRLARNEERTLYPFLLLKEDTVSIVRSDSTGYSVISKLAAATTTRANSPDNSVRIQTDGTKITATWRGKEPHPSYFCESGECSDSITVLESTTPIQDIVFYPNRNDVIVFASGATVSAIELDRNGTQNFQPIYSGTYPHIYKNKENLYVSDNNTLYLVKN